MLDRQAEAYFIVYKPCNMVSQFVSPHSVRLLGNLDFTFPEGTHAVGRLDKDSEGLLILTTNKKLTRLLFMGERLHRRTYLVQVNKRVTIDELERLRSGVTIKVQGGENYLSRPAEVDIIDPPEYLPAPAIELTPQAPYTWLKITLTEGKFHQVRKMIGAIRHRVHRLVRISIEDLTLGKLQPGEVREMEEKELFAKLFLNRD
jgi:23S rRNA pseudouridine2457 synthase